MSNNTFTLSAAANPKKGNVEPEVWLTMEECSEYLRISKKALFNMVSRGKVKRYKLGRRNRFLKTEVQKLITEY